MTLNQFQGHIHTVIYNSYFFGFILLTNGPSLISEKTYEFC